jgi:DNA-directed RNA polymerase specialized sigma24 family protein
MADPVDKTKKGVDRWELSPEALESLLRTLNPHRETAGHKYEVLRHKLIDFFAWSRSEVAEDLADETLNRLARRLIDGERIENVERYALGIARILLKEVARKRERKVVALREIQLRESGVGDENKMLDSIEQCLDGLPESSRDLIARYYSDERAGLARELGISMNTLRNRALRIRAKLYESLRESRDID